MKHHFLLALPIALASCGHGSQPSVVDRIADSLQANARSKAIAKTGFWRLELPVIDDNVRNDTLLVQATFDLGDGTFVMVASNRDETFEGLRLYRYTLLPDSNAQVLFSSAPAYDSWTMLPTFFRVPGDALQFVVLANFGEKQSWGQKVMILDAKGFHDLGFLDVASAERQHEEDTTYIKTLSIAPFTSIDGSLGAMEFTFTCDSLVLFDDLNGHHDTLVAAPRVRYKLDSSGIQLGVDGRFKPVPKPV